MTPNLDVDGLVEVLLAWGNSRHPSDPSRALCRQAVTALQALRAELTAQPSGLRPASTREPELDGWRSIESAPKDGTPVIAWWPHLPRPVVAWVGQRGRTAGGWIASHNTRLASPMAVRPTLWRPLDPPPSSTNTPSQDQGGESAG